MKGESAGNLAAVTAFISEVSLREKADKRAIFEWCRNNVGLCNVASIYNHGVVKKVGGVFGDEKDDIDALV